MSVQIHELKIEKFKPLEASWIAPSLFTSEFKFESCVEKVIKLCSDADWCSSRHDPKIECKRYLILTCPIDQLKGQDTAGCKAKYFGDNSQGRVLSLHEFDFEVLKKIKRVLKREKRESDPDDYNAYRLRLSDLGFERKKVEKGHKYFVRVSAMPTSGPKYAGYNFSTGFRDISYAVDKGLDRKKSRYNFLYSGGIIYGPKEGNMWWGFVGDFKGFKDIKRAQWWIKDPVTNKEGKRRAVTIDPKRPGVFKLDPQGKFEAVIGHKGRLQFKAEFNKGHNGHLLFLRVWNSEGESVTGHVHTVK